ncbi:DUF998 domain-containing protein [Microbispora corallina]|uniref:DUF998 domain-containing protein n=1 Tax=Microbispora corallina TaxID=83302 RepID=A0ABQ4G5T4_9ACTN|nr:DUF998 domain-containing protein [Microbispora corallina]GIH42433.1 hypothetical protein Mco01_54330 [Microbispora corallina]
MTDRLLLVCGLVAGPLFTVAYLVEGATRAHYKVLRHPVSSLALGDHGWTQTVNFFVGGLLSLAFAVGLWRAGPSHWGALLVGAWAIALLCAGIFRTDPVSGFPPGTPDLPQHSTRQGVLHDLLSLAGFVALAAACFVFAWSGTPGWAIYSIASGVLFAGTMVLASAAFAQREGLVDRGGLIQRVSVTIGWAWLAMLAVRTLHG